MSFITNKKILRLSNLSNIIVSFGAAILIAFFGGLSMPAIVISAMIGGWSLSNGYIARRLMQMTPNDADGNYVVRLDPAENLDPSQGKTNQ